MRSRREALLPPVPRSGRSRRSWMPAAESAPAEAGLPKGPDGSRRLTGEGGIRGNGEILVAGLCLAPAMPEFMSLAVQACVPTT